MSTTGLLQLCRAPSSSAAAPSRRGAAAALVQAAAGAPTTTPHSQHHHFSTQSTADASKPPRLRVARLPPLPIYARLCIEEALFYKTTDNWFVYSDGPAGAPPTVVLGISGRPERMCNLAAVAADAIPLVRRFSGGGTVIVDGGTMFTSLIVNQAALPRVQPYPREIMEWSRGVYGPAIDALLLPQDRQPPNPRLLPHDATGATAAAGTRLQLGLRENDYVFGDLKFGGNAQAISRGRWVHHTSFLWSFSPRVMSYLALPEKRPAYRGDRDHNDFLTPLERHLTARGAFAHAVGAALSTQFDVTEAPLEEIDAIVEGLGGAAAWAAACRTKYVGADGKAIDAPVALPESLAALARSL